MFFWPCGPGGCLRVSVIAGTIGAAAPALVKTAMIVHLLTECYHAAQACSHAGVIPSRTSFSGCRTCFVGSHRCLRPEGALRLARWPRRCVGTVRAMHLGSVDSLHPWRCTRTHEWDDWGAHVNFADQIKFVRGFSKPCAAGSLAVFFLRQPFWRLLLAPGARGGSVAVPGTHAGVRFPRVWLPRPLAKGVVFFPAFRAGCAP